MPLPYENSTSGDKAYADIQKILGQFGCDNYGIMHREKEQSVMIQFDWRGRQVQFKFSWAAMPLPGCASTRTPAAPARPWTSTRPRPRPSPRSPSALWHATG